MLRSVSRVSIFCQSFPNWRFFSLFLFLPALIAEEPEVEITFQVYLWRQLQSIEAVSLDPEQTNQQIPSGAETQSEADDTPPGVATQLYRAPEIYFYADGRSDLTRLNAAEGRLSRTFRYRGTNPLSFFRYINLEGEEERKEVLGEVTIEGSTGRMLLLFLPLVSGNGIYRILPLENSAQRIPPGNALVYNFTGTQLASRIGDRDFVLQPGDSERVSIRRVEDFTLPVHLAIRTEANEWEPIHREDAIVNPQSSLLFLIHRAHGDRNQLRILTLQNELD